MRNFKSLCLITICFFAFLLMTPMANAQNIAENETVIEILPNGDYITEVLIQENSHMLLTVANKTKTMSKYTRYKNVEGKTLWYVKVTGTFSYNGTKATCTKASCTAVSNSSLWTVGNKSSSKSGNTARATATGKKYQNFVCVESITKSATLKCTPNGNIY